MLELGQGETMEPMALELTVSVKPMSHSIEGEGSGVAPHQPIGTESVAKHMFTYTEYISLENSLSINTAG